MKGSMLSLAGVVLSAALILFPTASFAAKQEKTLICHVGNEMGPGGEVYLDDPDCVPTEANGYFCPDAGKIDLIVVANADKHLDNLSHAFDGIQDYEPSEVDASGVGTEDSDGNGIDDGCEPPGIACPCWDEIELQTVTAVNQFFGFNCSTATFFGGPYPFFALIQTGALVAGVEGGFIAKSDGPGGTYCQTRDFPHTNDGVSEEEADECIAQIAKRCEAIGDPIIP